MSLYSRKITKRAEKDENSCALSRIQISWIPLLVNDIECIGVKICIKICQNLAHEMGVAHEMPPPASNIPAKCDVNHICECWRPKFFRTASKIMDLGGFRTKKVPQARKNDTKTRSATKNRCFRVNLGKFVENFTS